jgi:hypothetical protein
VYHQLVFLHSLSPKKNPIQHLLLQVVTHSKCREKAGKSSWLNPQISLL